MLHTSILQQNSVSIPILKGRNQGEKDQIKARPTPMRANIKYYCSIPSCDEIMWAPTALCAPHFLNVLPGHMWSFSQISSTHCLNLFFKNIQFHTVFIILWLALQDRFHLDNFTYLLLRSSAQGAQVCSMFPDLDASLKCQ